MAEEMPSAESLAAEVTTGGPQPELTPRIEACRCAPEVKAGLFLLNGDWERSHKLAQNQSSAAGNHWHALVHRHEPDYANSKYWLRRVGDSPIYPELAAAAADAGQARRVAPGGRWDPLLFTDAYADPAEEAWTRRLDALEMHLLLEHCLARH